MRGTKTAEVEMELKDNGIGDVIEDEDQLGWSFFSGGNLDSNKSFGLHFVLN